VTDELKSDLDLEYDGITVVGWEDDYRDIVAGIRKRPGMYLGSTSQKGVNVLMAELIHILASADRSRQLQIEIRLSDKICLNVDNLDFLKDFEIEADLMLKLWIAQRMQSPEKDLFDISQIGSFTIANALSSECKLAIERDGKTIEINYRQGILVESHDMEIRDENYLSLELTIDRDIFVTASFDNREIEKIVNQISYFYPHVKFQIDNHNLDRSNGIKQLILDTIDLIHPFDYLSHYRELITKRDIFHAIESNIDKMIVGELLIGALPEANTTSLIGFVNCRRACLGKSSRQKFQHKLNQIIIDRLQKIDEDCEDLSKVKFAETSSIYPGLVCAIVIYTNQSIFAGPTRDYIQGELVDGTLDLLLDRLTADFASTHENMPGLLQQLYRTALYDY
jgi:DNA gyrase/topoisomerase IV subunit B